MFAPMRGLLFPHHVRDIAGTLPPSRPGIRRLKKHRNYLPI